MTDPTPERIAAPETEFQRRSFDLIVECFDRCQGMARHSTEESDAYWELAENLMVAFAEATAQPLLRKAEP